MQFLGHFPFEKLNVITSSPEERNVKRKKMFEIATIIMMWTLCSRADYKQKN